MLSSSAIMRTTLRILLVIALLGLHLSVLYAILHPKVSPEYKAYFIDRTSRDWRPQHYHVLPQEGIDLSREGLPDFVDQSYGISVRESFGRWTDTAMGLHAGFRLNRSFTGPVCLKMRLGASRPMLNQHVVVRFGDQQKDLLIDQTSLQDFALDYEESSPAHVLEFVFPKELPEASANDRRRAGLGIARIGIFPKACAAVGEECIGSACKPAK